MKSITLQTAVQISVNALLLAIGEFSAYDVTQAIRNNVDRTYEVKDQDVDFDDDDEPFTSIQHSEVNEIVKELFDNGLINATKDYKTVGGNTFIVYTSNDPTVQVAYPATPTSAPTPATTPSTTIDPIVEKINAYLKANGVRSIKQIQSTLKINGLTCADIARKIGFNRAASLSDSISKVLVNP